MIGGFLRRRALDRVAAEVSFSESWVMVHAYCLNARIGAVSGPAWHAAAPFRAPMRAAGRTT
jgi:hypothetical protein